jgi:hypothetical protein
VPPDPSPTIIVALEENALSLRKLSWKPALLFNVISEMDSENGAFATIEVKADA